MQTSTKGIAFLERHEGVVLKAYRDPVGIWTIGAGLTKASGVVTPKAGMRITAAEATRLLARALGAYERTVAQHMAGARQHEFDGGVSFHFNTGAIGRASWVKAWRARDWPNVRRRIMLWKKGGGRVLPGLVRRREEEYRLIHAGIYSADLPAPDPGASSGASARIVLPMTKGQIADLRAGLGKLGYDVRGPDFTVPERSVRAFQRDHDLTVDGIVGRATASTLQRMLDARAKSATAGVATAGGAAGVEALNVSDIAAAVPDGAVWLALGAGAIRLGWLAFTYRDALAARVQGRAPRIASFLRSF